MLSCAPQLNSSTSTLPPGKHASNTCPHISTQQVVTSPATAPQLIASIALLPLPTPTWHSSARNIRSDGGTLESCGRISSSTFSAHWGCIGTLGFRGSRRFKRRLLLICRERRRRRRGSRRWRRTIIMKSRRDYGKRWVGTQIRIQLRRVVWYTEVPRKERSSVKDAWGAG